MMTRQAVTRILVLLTLLAGLYACSPSNQSPPTSTPIPPTLTSTPSPVPPPPTMTLTLAPPTCLTQTRRVEKGTLDSTKPPQDFLIYLPPCYNENTEERYPVLYLLHGQTYTADQWIRLGAVTVLEELILSGESIPFILVFPDDRYWNLPSGAEFGGRLVDSLIPHIDEVYRTLPDRNHRAIGGLSRGAGWALRLGLTRWDLFSAIGLHSLAVLQNSGTLMDRWIKDIPPASRPVIFMDIGENDQELAMARRVEAQFNRYGIFHEWHLYSGGHTEEYWSAHVEQYIRWYAEQLENGSSR